MKSNLKHALPLWAKGADMHCVEEDDAKACLSGRELRAASVLEARASSSACVELCFGGSSRMKGSIALGLGITAGVATVSGPVSNRCTQCLRQLGKLCCEEDIPCIAPTLLVSCL